MNNQFIQKQRKIDDEEYQPTLEAYDEEEYFVKTEKKPKKKVKKKRSEKKIAPKGKKSQRANPQTHGERHFWKEEEDLKLIHALHKKIVYCNEYTKIKNLLFKHHKIINLNRIRHRIRTEKFKNKYREVIGKPFPKKRPKKEETSWKKRENLFDFFRKKHEREIVPVKFDGEIEVENANLGVKNMFNTQYMKLHQKKKNADEKYVIKEANNYGYPILDYTKNKEITTFFKMKKQRFIEGDTIKKGFFKELKPSIKKGRPKKSDYPTKPKRGKKEKRGKKRKRSEETKNRKRKKRKTEDPSLEKCLE